MPVHRDFKFGSEQCPNMEILTLLPRPWLSEYTHPRLRKFEIGERHVDLLLFLSGAFEFEFTFENR